MGERTVQADGFPRSSELVKALQSYLRLAPGAPEYGAIGGRGFDRVVYGPLFTTFVLAQTCKIQGQASSIETIAEQAKTIHDSTQVLRFDTGHIIPRVSREVLQEYAERQLADPRVEIAHRLAVGLGEQDHESEVVARDVQIILSRVVLDQHVERLPLPEFSDDLASNNLQAPVSDVA